MISIENIAYLTALQNRPVALAYGRLVVAGNVILRDDDYPTNGSTIFIALGEGEWDAPETVWLDGVELDPADYHFHPGTDGETGTGGVTGDQKIDAWFPAALEPTTFSRTAYIVVRVANPELAPSIDFDIRGVYRTRKVGIYDAGGTETSFAWSANPAWQILDLLLLHYPASRVDFASFVAAAAYCAATITVDSVDYPRFESHTPIADQMTLADALEAILSTCRGYLHDDQGKISIRIDQARAAAHTLSRLNTEHGSFRRWNRETRTDANRLVVELRDLEDDWAPTSLPIDREWHQDLFGGINEQTLRLGASTQQQARRLAHYYLTRAIDDQEMVEITALQDALHLQPGDRVDVSGDVATWEGLKAFEVVEVHDSTVDERRRLTLQEYDVNAFTDAGDPRQVIEGGVIVGPSTTPGVVPGHVTGLAIVSAAQDPEDPNLIRIEVSYTPPSPLEGFDGVEAHLEQPNPADDPTTYTNGRLLPQGWSPADGSGTGTAILRVTYPTRAERWYVYLLSRNATVVATFVHRAGGAPTPNIQVDVAENPRGITAPNVTGLSLTRIFRAIPLHSRTAEFTRTLDYVDANWTLPTGDPHFQELVQLRLTMVNQTTSEEKELTVLVVGHAAGQPTKFSIHSFPSPTTPTDFKVRVYAVNRFGRISASPAESAAITMGDIPGAPPVTAPSATPYYQDVGGVPHYGWDFAWTLPTGDADYDEGFDRVEPEGRVVGTGGSWIVFAKEGNGSTGVRTSSQPRQAFGEDWEFRFVSVNPGGVRNVAEAVSVGPVTVTAAPGATAGTGFTAARFAQATADGVETWGLFGQVDPQTIGANYQGTEIVGQVYEGNQIAQPSALNNAWWTKSNASVTPDAVAGPDGTTTADLLFENSATSTHLAQSTGLSSLADNEHYILACHVQRPATNGRHVTLGLLAKDGSFTFVRFNTTTGAVLGGGGPLLRSWATDAGGGWWFVGIEADMASGGTTPLVQVYVAQAGAENYAGDGVSGVYIWHAFVARFDPYEHVYAVTNGLFQTDDWPIANGPFVVWLRAYALNQHKQRTGTPESRTLFIAPGVGGLNAARLSAESLGDGLEVVGGELKPKLGPGVEFSAGAIRAKLGASIDFSGDALVVKINSLVNNMLQDDAVTGPKILASSVRAIDAVFAAAAIADADIANLNVSKLIGALIAGLEFLLISGDQQMEINGSEGFLQSDSTFSRKLQIYEGFLTEYVDGYLTASLGMSLLGVGGYGILSLERNSAPRAELQASGGTLGDAASGVLLLYSSTGVLAVDAGVDASGRGVVRMARSGGSDYALRAGTGDQKLIANTNTFSSGSRTIASGLTSILSATANLHAGAAPTEYIDVQWSGGSVTFRSSNTSSSAAFSYLIVGTV